MKYQKSSHATYDARYHIVWITKYRNPVLTKEMQERLGFVLEHICEKIWVVILKLWFEEDHVHMYARLPITKPVSSVIWYMKWASSNALKREFKEEIKEWYWKNKWLWAVWYFVCWVWEMNWDIVAKYVENQWREENKTEEVEL